MKRFLSLILILITLVMTFSACSGNVAYQPQKISASVSFRAKDYHCEGDFLFEQNGIKKFTINEPDIICGTVAEEKNGKVFLSYDGITSEIVADSPLKRLFVIAEDFSLSQHKISTKGIEMIEGITEEGKYEAQFDCFNKKIVSIKTEDTQYIFQ
ncbi:MAG: hypothetical protein II356_06580 [Clostridia bacterium]|nr:hypothetical protein [Clostridia bacterium]